MKLAKRMPALLAAGLLAVSLTGCSKEELRDKATDIIIDTATKMGFIDAEGEGEEEEVVHTEATAGGSVTFPEGFDPTQGRIPTTLQDGTLYVGFNGIEYRSTAYFVAAGTSATVTAYANHDNPNQDTIQYKIALWQLSEDQTKTSYVDGTTVYFTATADGQQCYSYTMTGLTPGRRYKLAISYDSTWYYITGGITVSNVSDQDLTDLNDQDAGAGA